MNVEKSTIFSIKRLSKDTLLYIPVFLAPALVNILLLMLFTRLFSPGLYGEYTIVVSTTIIISSLFSQWIVLSIQRFRPGYVEDGIMDEFNEHLKSLMFFITIAFITLSILFFWGFPDLLEGYKEYYWPSIFIILTSNYFMVLGSIYQIDLLTKEYRNINVILSIGKIFFIVVWLYVIQFNSIGFLWGTLIAQVVVLFPMVRKLKLGFLLPAFTYTQSALEFYKTFLFYGFPLIGWYVGTTVLNLTDRYMIEYFQSTYEVGVYSANFTIAVQALALTCNPLFFAAQPLLMNEAKGNVEKVFLEKRIAFFTKVYILIALPFGAYFSIFREEVSFIILGEKFSEGTVIIPILIAGFFAWNLGLYGQLCCQIDKRTKHMFFFVIIAAVMNFILNLILIPKFGFIGAGISTSIGFILYTLLLYFSSFNHTKWIIPWKTFIKVSVISLLLIGVTYVLKTLFLDSIAPLGKMLIGLLYFVCYAGMLIIFGELPYKFKRK